MAKREIPPEAHEVEKQDKKVRFLYFIRDLGIKSANEVAVKEWSDYAWMLAQLTVGG